MSLRFHEIAEAGHRILNPLTDDKLELLGEICRVTPATRQLDLACGKGELLTRWSQRYGSVGVGVDISQVFLAAARDRADELGVAERVRFVEADAATYEDGPGTYDIVSCIGATWIGNGLLGTLDLMRRPLRSGGLALVGECFWSVPPPAEAYESLQIDEDAFTSLAGTAERFESAGFELLEMVLANQDTWDRYAAGQWWTLSDWLRDHPDDPEAPAVSEFLDRARRSYLEYGRQYLGWGVFVLRGHSR
ncbi:SAM-dependent methyltransferase [Nonomuraea lactucae]|uniref:SAM-dependent methyltransferase n=1 Tax=Nonomuraea lactucae TaxID=2249762 RepID=UPI000DE3E783|nr:methyltransferase domain-containing protein [Nonomuraea lactucae]